VNADDAIIRELTVVPGELPVCVVVSPSDGSISSTADCHHSSTPTSSQPDGRTVITLGMTHSHHVSTLELHVSVGPTGLVVGSDLLQIGYLHVMIVVYCA